jgi:cytochrome c2
MRALTVSIGYAGGAPPPARSWSRAAAGLLLTALVPLLLAGCFDDSDEERHYPAVQGNPANGLELIGAFGCGSCHEIPGVNGADGVVGPPLQRIGRRIYLAGVLRNTPEAMVFWLRNPQLVVPGNAMPDMGISADQARDMTAYLYTLR